MSSVSRGKDIRFAEPVSEIGEWRRETAIFQYDRGLRKRHM
jgi:hypothetical protein